MKNNPVCNPLKNGGCPVENLREILLNQLGLENKSYTLEELDLALIERRKSHDGALDLDFDFDMDFQDLDRELSEWTESLDGLDGLLDGINIDNYFEED